MSTYQNLGFDCLFLHLYLIILFLYFNWTTYASAYIYATSGTLTAGLTWLLSKSYFSFLLISLFTSVHHLLSIWSLGEPVCTLWPWKANSLGVLLSRKDAADNPSSHIIRKFWGGGKTQEREKHTSNILYLRKSWHQVHPRSYKLWCNNFPASLHLIASILPVWYLLSNSNT